MTNASTHLNVLHWRILKRTRTTCVRAWISWNAFELTHGMLTEIEDDALRTTLGASLGSVATFPFNGGSQAAAGFSLLNLPPRGNDGKRYQLIRPHAQGGIGQVWVAPTASCNATWH